MTGAKVSIICPDVSENCLGRAHVLARLLQPRYEAEIVGPRFGEGVWAPLADDDAVPVFSLPLPRYGVREAAAGWRRLRTRLDGDAVYVSKPFATSLWAARRTPRKDQALLLDIDDWEPGLLRQAQDGLSRRQKSGRFLQGLRSLHHRRPWNVAAGDRMARRVEVRTVSNRFLQGRYGGTLIWHARDTDHFDPARVDAPEERRQHGLDGRFVVMFLGTPRSHKGLRELAEAVGGLPSDAVLVVAGVGDGPDGRAVRAAMGQDPRVRLLPPMPFRQAPQVLAMADVVAIPQQVSPASAGQMPAKVFDAMAMGKPVVATPASDLPEVLDRCGLVVDGSASALRDALGELHGDDGLRRRLGKAARQRCVESYSYVALRPVLQGVVAAALRNRGDA
jgi:glycosyltransferase involved in cell wall biosynthesis